MTDQLTPEQLDAVMQEADLIKSPEEVLAALDRLAEEIT